MRGGGTESIISGIWLEWGRAWLRRGGGAIRGAICDVKPSALHACFRDGKAQIPSKVLTVDSMVTVTECNKRSKSSRFQTDRRTVHTGFKCER